MSYEPTNLHRWTMPNSYMGEVWPAYYSAGFGQSRDSDDLEASNFATALAELGGESDTVTVVRESHWAVGWIEWIAIHQDDDRALAIADALVARYRDYPALDENDWSEREWNHACEAWGSADMRWRVDLCREAGVSIFAARRAEIPSDDNGYIQQALIGC